MSLETAAWISELDPTNPPGTDKKKQGDDHIRLIKAVIKAVFPNASKAWYLPEVPAAKTANFNVLASDQNKTFIMTTIGGNFTATLPTLVSGDAGWECFFIKTGTDANAFFVAPPTGTIQSGEFAVAKARRAIPGVRISAFWTGAAWICSRALQAPVGSIVDMGVRTTAPVGYAVADGSVIGVAADYPELYLAQTNSTQVADRRGRVGFGRDNMGGGAAGRISAGAGGLTPNASIGSEFTILTQGNMPNYGLPVTDPGHGHAVVDPGHVHPGAALQVVPVDQNDPDTNAASTNAGGVGTPNTGSAGTGIAIVASSTGIFVGTGGSNAPFTRLPPGIICNIFVVTE